jgi:hypothetical protein
MTKKYGLLLLILSLSLGCGFSVFNENLQLKKDPSYPRWLASENIHADQTSGIAFIKEAGNGDKYFLLADDTGSILHLKIERDTIFTIKPVIFSEKFKAYIDTFPEADFEEIVYDNNNNEAFLSIEGNGPHPERYAGIYNITFRAGDVLSDTLDAITKISITPHTVFQKYLANNIGYEGLAADDNYFYLGLEGFTNGKLFADSTVLFIADRKSCKIIKQINTRSMGIHTICGLFSDKNYSVYGIDRNNKSFFHILFDSNLNIIDTAVLKIETSIPNYNSFDYVASIESITMDPERNVYMVDDPWKTFFVPSKEILGQVDSLTVNRFRNFVPVIFKYSMSK